MPIWSSHFLVEFFQGIRFFVSLASFIFNYALWWSSQANFNKGSNCPPPPPPLSLSPPLIEMLSLTWHHSPCQYPGQSTRKTVPAPSSADPWHIEPRLHDTASVHSRLVRTASPNGGKVLCRRHAGAWGSRNRSDIQPWKSRHRNNRIAQVLQQSTYSLWREKRHLVFKGQKTILEERKHEFSYTLKIYLSLTDRKITIIKWFQYWTKLCSH